MMVKDKNKAPTTKTLGGQASISIEEVQAEALKLTKVVNGKFSLLLDNILSVVKIMVKRN